MAGVAGWGAYGGAVGELKNSLPALMARRSHVGAHGHAVPQVPLSRDLVAMSADVGEEQKLLKMHYLCGSYGVTSSGSEASGWLSSVVNRPSLADTCFRSAHRAAGCEQCAACILHVRIKKLLIDVFDVPRHPS